MDSVAPRGRLVLSGVAHAGLLVALFWLLFPRPYAELERTRLGLLLIPLFGLTCAVPIAQLVVSFARTSSTALLPLALGVAAALYGALGVQLSLSLSDSAMLTGSFLRGGWSSARIYALSIEYAQPALLLGLLVSAVASCGSGVALLLRGRRQLGVLCLGFAVVTVTLLEHARAWHALHQAAAQGHAWGHDAIAAVDAALDRSHAALVLGWVLVALLVVAASALRNAEPGRGRTQVFGLAGTGVILAGLVLHWAPRIGAARLTELAKPILWDVVPASAWSIAKKTEPRRNDTLFLGAKQLLLEQRLQKTKELGPRSRLAEGTCGDLLGDLGDTLPLGVNVLPDRTATFRELVCGLVSLQYGPVRGDDTPAPLPWGMRASASYNPEWRWPVLLVVQDKELPAPYHALTRHFVDVGVRLVSEVDGGLISIEREEWRYDIHEIHGRVSGDLQARMHGLREAVNGAHTQLTLTAPPDVSAEDVLNAALALELDVVRILPSTSTLSR